MPRLREPNLSRPRADKRVYRELKLLVDHRDDLVDQRRRTQQRLRWHLHQLDPTYELPLRRLDRASHLDRVGRWLASREQELQVRIARELVSTCRALNRAIGELDHELEQRTAAVAPALLELPGCAALTAAKLLAEIGPIDRFRSDAQLARHSGVAPLQASSGRSQRHRLDRGGNRQLNAALYRIAITQARYWIHPVAPRSLALGTSDVAATAVRGGRSVPARRCPRSRTPGSSAGRPQRGETRAGVRRGSPAESWPRCTATRARSREPSTAGRPHTHSSLSKA